MGLARDLQKAVSMARESRTERALRTFGARHGEDVALEVALEDAPRALVDHEGRLAREARVQVSLGDYPRGRVRNAEVEDLAGRDEMVQAIHDFLDTAGVIPPMQVEDIDVVGSELLEGSMNGNMHRFEVVARVMHLLLDVLRRSLEVRRVL